MQSWSDLMGSQAPWVAPALGTTFALVFASSFATTMRLIRGFAAAADSRLDPPQAILVLGGDRHREQLAARFAAGAASKIYTNSKHATSVKLLPVYVSSAHDDAGHVMKRAGVHPSRLHIDNRALDTVTNFTTMASTFKAANYTHVYIVTSEYHMERADMLASLILRSHGIACTAVRLPADGETTVEPETQLRLQRDRLRAWLWMLVGWHGAELLRFTKPKRYREHKQKDVLPKDTD